MTREEAQRLLSGYATGSLTELEQQLLFDAALEDQELFNELAAENAIKELIELPGAKRRLLEALGPEKRAFLWWPWAVGVAAMMIAVSVWMWRPVAAPVEMARVEAPSVGLEVPAPVEVAPAAPVTVGQTEPAEKSTALADNFATPTDEELRLARAPGISVTETAPSPAPAPNAPAPTPPAPKEEVLPVPTELEARSRQQLPVLQGAGVAAPPAAAPAKSALLPERQDGLLRTESGTTSPRSADALKQIPITTFGAGKGKALAAPPPKPAATQILAETAALATSAARGTLTYEVRNTGILRMTPSRSGVLEVTFDGRPLYPPTSVTAGTSIDVSIPLEAQQLRLNFAAAANAPDAVAQTGGVTGTLLLPETAIPRAIVVIPAQR